MTNLTTNERAFALARSGTTTSVDDLRRRLKAERYEAVGAHPAGSMAKQLAALIRAARQPGAQETTA